MYCLSVSLITFSVCIMLAFASVATVVVVVYDATVVVVHAKILSCTK